jgi:ABC-type uncharacterized transport systems, ATPase components
MKEDGKSIIIITHKLNEVMEVSDRVAILRRGEHVATVNTSETSEAELTEMMVGKKIDLNIHRSVPVNAIPRLIVEDLNLYNAEGVHVLKVFPYRQRRGNPGHCRNRGKRTAGAAGIHFRPAAGFKRQNHVQQSQKEPAGQLFPQEYEAGAGTGGKKAFSMTAI